MMDLSDFSDGEDEQFDFPSDHFDKILNDHEKKTVIIIHKIQETK